MTGQLLEHFVPRVVAKAVVDLFEMVDIDGDDGKRRLLRLEGGDGGLQMAAVAQASQRVGVDVFAQLGDVALQQVNAFEHGLFQLVRFKVPRLDGLNLVRSFGLVHVSRTIGQLAQRAGNAAGTPPDQQQHQNGDRQRFVQHGSHQIVEGRQRCLLGALGHDAPAGAGNHGIAGQHFAALAVDQRCLAGFTQADLVDGVVVVHLVAHARAVGVVDDVLVLVHNEDIGAVFVEVRAQQCVQHAFLLQVDAAAHGAQVLAICRKNRLRDKDDEVAGNCHIRLADDRAFGLQAFHNAAGG